MIQPIEQRGARQIDRSLQHGRRATLLVLLAASILPACRDRGVAEHIVDKGVEKIPQPDTQSTPAPTAESDPSEPGATLPAVPPGWELDPEPRPMRLATYVISDPPLEVAVTRFPGRVGGTLANINRWRGQMGLGPVSQEDLDSVLTTFEGPGYDGYEARIESEAGVMLASAVYEAAADRTWFVRTTTTGDSADRVQATVFAFARTIMSSGGG